MPLPHFTNLQTATDLWEPLYKNLFEVTFILPAILGNIHGDLTHLLLQNAVSVTLPSYPDLGTKEQRFKYSTREYLLMPDKTSLTDITVKFNLNQINDPDNSANYQVPVWRVMKDWYDLAWNNEDGSLHYKRNMIGDIIVHQHDREGHIIRRVVYHNAQMFGFDGWKGSTLDWNSNDIVDDFAAKFAIDWWEDFYY